uniref:Uncharacterized protein n=1 Tax=Parascaris univalens TaxID=6257 RepID=A0A915BM87_PARUN
MDRPETNHLGSDAMRELRKMVGGREIGKVSQNVNSGKHECTREDEELLQKRQLEIAKKAMQRATSGAFHHQFRAVKQLLFVKANTDEEAVNKLELGGTERRHKSADRRQDNVTDESGEGIYCAEK